MIKAIDSLGIKLKDHEDVIIPNLTFDEMLERKLLNMNSRTGELNKTDGIECDECLNKGELYYIDEYGYEAAKNCKCMHERNIYRELQYSGLLHEFRTRTFDNYLTTQKFQEVIKNKALNYVDEIARTDKDDTKKWFAMLGQSGSGKTHISTAVCEALIKQGKRFKYFPFARQIKGLINDLRSFDIRTKEDAEVLIQQYRNVEVLYIDDFLKVKVNDLVFELIDYRYSNDLITIISSELSLAELMQYDSAVAGRISQKTGDNNEYLIQIKNDPTRNYRMKGGTI